MSNRRYMVGNGRYRWKIADMFGGTVNIALLMNPDKLFIPH
ncbi:hypothetical protein [Bacillus cereus]